MRILVTGASGFAGAMLIPRLIGGGHDVRAFARDPQSARTALTSQLMREGAIGPAASGLDQEAVDAGRADGLGKALLGLEVVRGDLLTGEGLAPALAGVEVAYYLVHSMESPRRRSGSRAAGPQSHSLLERERYAATRFARAARQAGTRRIIYLGGLVPNQWSPSRHLASRYDVERILLDAVEDSLALRASIVIAARSRSFRLLVRLVERLPVLALPPWRLYRTQPIDGRDLTAMLASAAAVQLPGGTVMDVAGPDVVSYGEMLQRIADCMLVRRVQLPVRITGTSLSARVAAAITGEDPALTLSLMEGLRGDLLPSRPATDAAQTLGVELHPFGSALEHALREWEAVEPLAAR